MFKSVASVRETFSICWSKTKRQREMSRVPLNFQQTQEAQSETPLKKTKLMSFLLSLFVGKTDYNPSDLMDYIRQGNDAAVSFLVKSPNLVRETSKTTALFCAVGCRNSGMLETMLSEWKPSPYIRREDGGTLLHCIVAEYASCIQVNLYWMYPDVLKVAEMLLLYEANYRLGNPADTRLFMEDTENNLAVTPKERLALLPKARANALCLVIDRVEARFPGLRAMKEEAFTNVGSAPVPLASNDGFTRRRGVMTDTVDRTTSETASAISAKMTAHFRAAVSNKIRGMTTLVQLVAKSKYCTLSSVYVHPILARPASSGAAQPIFPENLFASDNEKSCWHLVIGEAGMGKTTLCKFIAESWLTGGTIWTCFKWIFWIHLRRVVINKYKSMPEILYHECFGGGNGVFTMEDVGVLWEQLRKSGRVLLLLDGFDLVTDEYLGSRLPVLKTLIDCRDVSGLIFSRPCPALEMLVDIDSRVNIEGFTEEQQVRDYTHKWFDVIRSASDREDDAALACEVFLRCELLRPLTRTPLILELLCTIWHSDGLSEEKHLRSAAIEEISRPKACSDCDAYAISQVYPALLYYVTQRYLYVYHPNWSVRELTLRYADTKRIRALAAAELRDLGRIAAHFLIQQQQRSWADFEKIYPKITPLSQLLTTGFLRTEADRPSYTFVSPAFRAFFAATFVADWVRNLHWRGLDDPVPVFAKLLAMRGDHHKPEDAENLWKFFDLVPLSDHCDFEGHRYFQKDRETLSKLVCGECVDARRWLETRYATFEGMSLGLFLGSRVIEPESELVWKFVAALLKDDKDSWAYFEAALSTARRLCASTSVLQPSSNKVPPLSKIT
jgi:hypothetical protein